MENQSITKKEMTLAEGVVEKLLSSLNIEGTFELVADGGKLDVLLDTKDTGMVIGYHGEGLDSIQLMLSLIISKTLNRFIRTSLDVDGYKKNRTDYLEKLALSFKDKALSENIEQVFPPLRSWERRIVHVYLQDDEEVATESRGEGKERVLVVKPKS